MKLTLEGREKLRKSVEDLLQSVPANKKIQLPNETLEQLLFEEVVVNKKEDIKVKFPVWSGEFLRKLDLSRVDFKNVSWSGLDRLTGADSTNMVYHFYKRTPKPGTISGIESIKIFDDFDSFANRLNQIFSLKRLYAKKIDYSKTNITLDFSNSFEARYLGYNGACGCNFSGCNVCISDMSLGIKLRGNDFSNSTIKMPKKVNATLASRCNFENCDLSQSEFDISEIFGDDDNNIRNNLRNTGAKLTYDSRYDISKLIEKGINSFMVGCYLDGKLITDEQVELDKMLAEISSTISSQLDEETPKTM